MKTHSIQDLSFWRQIAYSTAVLERMLPNYRMFAEAANFGDYAVLRNQLDLVWQWLGKGQLKINVDAQLEKLELQIPDSQLFDFFGVYPAIDVCMALECLLQGLQSKDAETLSSITKLSTNSVSFYIETLLVEEVEDIESHPLMQWEHETLAELLTFVTENKENDVSCRQLKKMALAEGITNLGIEV